MSEPKNAKHSAWMEFADWLRREAERRSVSLQKLQPYAGFWAKVSSGRIRSIPPEVICGLEQHFRKSIEELANEAGVALFLRSGNEPANVQPVQSSGLPIFEPEHEIFITWSDGVPDHMWPYVAYRRGYFTDARIKATILDAECASDFPEGYGQAMKSCLPRDACGVGTWNEMHELQGWPIALTHDFVGFAAVGRAPSRIKPLVRNSAHDFGRLMFELSKRQIGNQRVGCVTENSIEFLRIAADLGQQCLTDVRAESFPFAEVTVAVERTPNMLEELYELGKYGWDLVVGHALTHGLALQNPDRYQVYFSWDRLCSIAQKIKSPLADQLERLAVPAPLMLNREPGEADRALVCRLWSIAYRATRSILGDMPPSAAAELLGELKSLIPYSNPNDATITPAIFSNVWHKSYRPLTLEQMLTPLDYQRSPADRHDSLRRALAWVREEKEGTEKRLAALRGNSSAKAKRAVALAEQFISLGNFYDAQRVLL